MLYKNNTETNGDVKEKIDEVFRKLNGNSNKDSGKRTSPIRSNNSSVLGKSKKPVNIK